MAVTVNTYTSPQALQNVIGGTVTVIDDENALAAALDAATNLYKVLGLRAKFTIIDNPNLANLVDVVEKGEFYTVIVNTP